MGFDGNDAKDIGHQVAKDVLDGRAVRRSERDRSREPVMLLVHMFVQFRVMEQSVNVEEPGLCKNVDMSVSAKPRIVDSRNARR